MKLTHLLTLSTVAALLLGLTACNKPADPAAKPGEGAAPTKPGKKQKIAFVSNGVASFWTIAAAGVKAAGEKLGVDAQTLMPVEGIGDQKRMIEDLLTKGVDGIAVSPIDPANQTDLLNTAAKRAKLITHDSDAPNADRLVYIGMDNYKAGRLCGDLVREAMPNGGTVMIFIGRMEQDNAKRRRQGTIDAILGRPENPSNFDPADKVLEGGGFKILGTLTDQFDQAKGKANAEDTLAKYPDIGGMVGLFAYNPPLMLEALQQAAVIDELPPRRRTEQALGRPDRDAPERERDLRVAKPATARRRAALPGPTVRAHDRNAPAVSGASAAGDICWSQSRR